MHLKEELNKGRLEAVRINGKHLMVLASADTEKSNTMLEKNQLSH
tara:strand:- start:156439 stop:156573 length:135 start_codon:yes stop_codon:yes gene_type:complete